MAKLTESVLDEGKKVIDALVAIPTEQRTYQNTILPFAQFEVDLEGLSHNIGFYKSVSSDKAQVAKSLEMVKMLEGFGQQQLMRMDFYNALKSYIELAKKN